MCVCVCYRYMLIMLCGFTAAAASSTLVAADLAATVEKLKSQLLQKQSDFTAVLQAFEEYKEVTK